MKTFRHVFFEMNANERHLLTRSRDHVLRILRISEIVQRHLATRAQGQIVLRDLIILRHVRIEIILAIEFTERRNFAAEHQSRQHRQAQRLVIHHRQRARQAETDRTGQRIRLRPKLDRASAKHLRARLQLDVYFETDRDQIFHTRAEFLSTAFYSDGCAAYSSALRRSNFFNRAANSGSFTASIKRSS